MNLISNTREGISFLMSLICVSLKAGITIVFEFEHDSDAILRIETGYAVRNLEPQILVIRVKTQDNRFVNSLTYDPNCKFGLSYEVSMAQEIILDLLGSADLIHLRSYK